MIENNLETSREQLAELVEDWIDDTRYWKSEEILSFRRNKETILRDVLAHHPDWRLAGVMFYRY